MMKSFLCCAVLLSGAVLFAAPSVEPSPAALAGEFASALQITSAPVRQAALLKILVASAHDESINCAAYGLLVAEFDLKAPDKAMQKRIAQLYAGHPANLMIVLLYTRYVDTGNKLAVLTKALNEIDPAAWLGQRFTFYLEMLEAALDEIAEEGDILENEWIEKVFEQRLAMLDSVIAKRKKEDPALISLRLDLIRDALYYCDDLVPEQKQFKELPANNRRKKLYTETLARWKKSLFAKDRKAFFAQFEMAVSLALPECDSFAAEAVRRYGVMDEEVRNRISEAAILRKKYALYRPCADGNRAGATLIALMCRDFDAAAKAADTPLLKRYVAVGKAVDKLDRAAIFRILDSVKPQMPFTHLEYQAVLQMAESSRDAELYQRLKKMILAQIQQDEVRVELANSLGFVAVSLNTDLDFAQKLLEWVYNEQKNAAYVDSLAMLRLRQKRYAEAENLIREAFSLRESSENASVFLLHAAEIMAARGDKAKARKLLERAKKCVRPEDVEYDFNVEKKLTEMLK